MLRKALAIIISILILSSHFDAILHLQAHGEETDAVATIRKIEEELEKGRVPSGSITEANFIVPEGFPIELAKRLWLFLAQLISTGCSDSEIRQAIIDANDTLRLPMRMGYELKNYTIIPKYDEARIIRRNDGSVSVEIPYKVVDGRGRDVDVSSIRYESNGTSLSHVLHRYPKRRTYLVRVVDPDAYILTFIDLKTGEIFNKTARVNIRLFSNATQGSFGFESFVVAVPGHFEETREAIKSQVSEFRVLLPAHDPLVVDTSISPTRVKIGDVITVSARIRNPQEARDFRVLLGVRFSDEEVFEAWAPPPVGFPYGSRCPASYLYLRAKRPGVYQVTIYFAVIEPKNLDVVFWNGGKTVTYVVTVLPEAPRLRVEVEAEALAKFANLSITLVNTGGQEATGVKLLVTGDVEEKELGVGRVWHTWRGSVITKLLSPIAKVNVTAIYHDLEGKRHTSTSLTTLSTTNFVTPEEWRTYLIEVKGYEETKRVFVPGYRCATHVKLYLMKNCLAPSSISFFSGLSLIPISPKGFTLTLGNASSIEAPEVRYMLLDVKPGFLYERVLREDEVKKLFHINEDERLEPSKIPPSYEVKLVKEEVLNQSEIVTVNDDFYEKLKYSSWEDHDYKYEDTGVRKWDLDKAIASVLHDKTIELVYRPLMYQGGLVKGVLVKNYAAWDIVYELEILQWPIAENPPENIALSIPAHGSIPLSLIQRKSASHPVLIYLKYHGRIVASLQVHATGEVSEFWRGFWDGIKERLPGIIVTATIMVILAIPTHGGSLLAYVKDLMASAVIPSLFAVGVASNIREALEAYSAYKKMDEVAGELDGFSQRAAYAGYFNEIRVPSKIAENPPENIALSIPAHGSIPLSLIQRKSASHPVLIYLKYHGRIVASLQVHATGEVSEFWRGFWDGIKERLPGIIVTATIMVILAIPTHGGSLLAYVKDLMASAVIPSLFAVGVASNIREALEAYSAYKKMDEVAGELDGFSQRAAYAGYFNAYYLFQGLRSKIKENQGYTVGDTALDLLADVTIRDLLVTFGSEDARGYEKGKALGRLVGSALSLATYVGIYYKFLSNGPKLLSRAGRIKEFLKGVYNWITPPLWDIGIIAGKLTARGIAASLAISGESGDFKEYLNRIKDDEESLSSLVESTGRFLDDALDVSGKLGLSEEAFLGLLRAYGKCRLSKEAWDKFIQEIEEIDGKNKKCADEFLRLIFNAESYEVEYAVIKLAPKLAKLGSDELGCLEKLLASGVGMKEIGSILEKPDGLKELLAGIKVFEFREPHGITLKRGEDRALNMGKDNKLSAGTYVARIYWECGEKKGVMEFPVKSRGSKSVGIPEHQVDQVLNEIGGDEVEILVTKAEFLDYRLFFPKEFSVGGIEIKLDLFKNEMKIGGKSFKFELDTDIWGGRIHVHAELEGKDIGGNNLVIFFYDDREVRIRIGGNSYLVKRIELDSILDLMRIGYLDDIEDKPKLAEYSFNFKSLNEQTGKRSYLAPLEKGQKCVGLKRKLFRLLGYNALKELERDIGSKYGVILEYDNGEMAYCGTDRFGAHVPDGASEIRYIRIVLIDDETSSYLRQVIEADDLSKVKTQVGIAGERIVILGYRGIDYREMILAEFSKKTGIPLEVFRVRDTVDFQHIGGKRKPDGKIFALKDIVVNGKVVFKSGDTIAIIEMESTVRGGDLKKLCDDVKNTDLKEHIKLDEYKDVQYGVAIGFSYDPVRALAGEPDIPPLIEVYTRGELAG
ncbi:MAG: hypothetical protein FGF51_06850 [Candidatus Brockarchaeota archaeon]|nr:hypothetical protein [Candidatus Brockarchaeota archaeon]